MAKIVSRGDPIEPVYLNNLKQGARGWAVTSGLAVSQRGAGANMSIDVAVGHAIINNTEITKVSITNVAITAAHASYDRYDLVVINSSGTISVIDGTAAATSYANDYDLETNNAILLAEVYVPATDTTIEDAQITDKRIFFNIINPLVIPPCLEEYSNHLGATDNFTETATAGNGVASADSTNHEMDLSTGTSAIGYALFQSKDSWALSTDIIVVNFVVQNIVLGVGGERKTFVALKNDFTDKAYNKMCGFYEDGNGDWFAYTREIGSAASTGITSLANGDRCTIVATSSKILYYVNGVLVATHTANLPSSALHLGVSVSAATTGTTTAVSISVDMMGIKVYY